MVLYRTHGVDIHLPIGGIDDAQQSMQVGATRDELPPILAADTFHHRGCGADDIGVGQLQSRNPGVEALCKQESLVLAAMAVFVTVGKLDELAERGIAVTLPRLNLCLIKLVVVVT